ncbi:hypothetical protein PT076_08825, partial [Erysipelothrix rhusiopathiae]|nr:hypothetical protein [Erysipelothrix rhusiopathiae]
IGVDRIFTAVDIAYWILMVCLLGLVIARVLSSRFGIHIPFAALNEIRVENIVKTQALEIYIDDCYFETFRGNGVCISGKYGST